MPMLTKSNLLSLSKTNVLALAISMTIMQPAFSLAQSTPSAKQGTAPVAPVLNARGTGDTGGAVSVQDPRTGGRTLADLVEKGLEFIRYDYGSNINPRNTFSEGSKRKERESLIASGLARFGDPLKSSILSLKNYQIFAQALLIVKGDADKVESLKYVKQLQMSPININKLRWAFLYSDLEFVNDEGALLVPNPETKKQLAIQYPDKALVVISAPEYYELDLQSQNALFLHEAVLYVLKKLKPEILSAGTGPARQITKFLDNWARYRHQDNADERLLDSLHDFEIDDASLSKKFNLE
jgi:hypothetical protein